MALPALALGASALPGVVGIPVPWSVPPDLPAKAPARVVRAAVRSGTPQAREKPKLTQRAGPIPTGHDARPPALDPPPSPAAGLTLAGGAVGGRAFGLAAASLGTPFGTTAWAQVDGLAGAGSRGGFGGAAFQVMAGDPRLSALGLYAGGSVRQGVDVLRLGVTGVVTRGDLSAVGTVGFEDVGGRLAFFDMADIVYRPLPNLALSVGHRRVDGRDLAAAGMAADVGGGVSVVGEGRFGPGLPGRDPEVAGLLGVRFGLGGGTSAAIMPSRLVDDALAPPGRRAR